jgi:hypothetical protein
MWVVIKTRLRVGTRTWSRLQNNKLFF